MLLLSSPIMTRLIEAVEEHEVSINQKTDKMGKIGKGWEQNFTNQHKKKSNLVGFNIWNTPKTDWLTMGEVKLKWEKRKGHLPIKLTKKKNITHQRPETWSKYEEDGENPRMERSPLWPKNKHGPARTLMRGNWKVVTTGTGGE